MQMIRSAEGFLHSVNETASPNFDIRVSVSYITSSSWSDTFSAVATIPRDCIFGTTFSEDLITADYLKS